MTKRRTASITDLAQVRREKDRLQRELERLRVRHYAAARQPSGRAAWLPGTYGPTDAVSAAWRTVADRARDAVRNSAYAARIVDVLTANLVGAGVQTRWTSPLHAEAWSAWTSAPVDVTGWSDWAGVQALVIRAVVESGEALVLRRRVPPTAEDPVGLRLQVLEGDRLDWMADNRLGRAAGGAQTRNGIELDQDGRPVAYHLLSDDGAASRKTVRVPAEDVIHVYRRRRPGQLRDVSWLAPILWSLRDLGEYETALLRKAYVEACLALIVLDDSEETLTGATRTELVDSAGVPVEDIAQQSIVYRRGPGSIETVAPTGGGSHVEFARRTLQAIAVGVGLTYDQLSGDLSQANYSSLRAGRIEFRRHLEQLQHTVVLPFVDRVARWFHQAGAELRLWAPILPQRVHVPPPPEVVDPQRDVAAIVQAVRAGLLSPQDAIAQLGYDWREVARETAEANALWDELGLISELDPRRTSRSGQAQDAAQNAAIEIAATGAARPPSGGE